MSMNFNLLQSIPSKQGFDLDVGEIKLQYNMALNELNVVSANFEQYMDACERFITLCDCVDANEGMLDPIVRDFVNRNGELSSALGIDLAMEDDSQDTQKQNGEAVTENKQGILRRMWEGIKKFFRAILDAIGSFFHWLGNLFAGTSKRIDWLKSDGKEIASKITKIPESEIKGVLFGQEKDGKIPITVIKNASTSSESMDQFAIESDNENTYTFDLHWIVKANGDLYDLTQTIKEYIQQAQKGFEEDNKSLGKYKERMLTFATNVVNSISLELLNLLDIKSIHLSDNGKFEVNVHEKGNTVFKVDMLGIIHDYDNFVGMSEAMLKTSYSAGENVSNDARAAIKRFDTLIETFGKETASVLKVVSSNMTVCLTLLGKIVTNIDKLNIDLQKKLFEADRRLNLRHR